VNRDETYNVRSRLSHAVTAVRLVRNFPTFLLNYFRPSMTGRASVYVLRDGLRVKLRNRTTDFMVLREICDERVYLRHGLRIGKQDVVVDIGAHIGLFSLVAARLAREGRVFSAEPHPGNFELLEENLSLNGCTHVAAHRVAISDSSGEVELHIRSLATKTASHTLLTFAPDVPQESVRARALTLSEFLERCGVERVHFLKLDCEGAETGILAGAPHALFKRIDTVAMELHPERGCTEAWARERFERMGYAVKSASPYLYATRKA